MFKKLKKKKAKEFSTYDIETAPNGSILGIGVYNPYLDEYNEFDSWAEFFNFLRLKNHIKSYQMLFAHNAGNFDAVSLIHWMLKENPDYDNDNCQIIPSGSTVVFMEYSEFNNKIVFGDSFLVLKSSLKKLCEIFEPEHFKLETFDIKMIYQIYCYEPDLMFEYLKHDCVALAEIMFKFMELMEINFFPLTIASFAMYIYRHKYLKDFQVYKPTKKQDEFISKAYAGGRVECFRQGYHEQVYTYDINSLYPYVMSKAQIPVNVPPVKTAEFIKGKTGFYKVKFNQFNRDMPPVLWKKTLEDGLTFVYEGVGVFCSIELENAERIGCHISVEEGYYFPETDVIFYDFVDYHYSERLIYKQMEKETGIKQPMQLLYKLILNSLYGKFAQREESKHLEVMDTWKRERYLSIVKVIDIDGKETQRDINKLEGGDKVIMQDSCYIDGTPIKDGDGNIMQEPVCVNHIGIYDEKLGIMEVTTNREIDYRIVYISAIVTAMARTELYKYLEKYHNQLVYCDTDSVHLLENGCMNIGELLGQMKPEESGAAVHIGRKMYGILDKKPKIKFKGITNNCKLGGDSLTFNDLKTILEQSRETEQDSDKVYKFSFNTFPKIRTCLKGKATPAKMVRVTKELKKPKFTTNFNRQEKEIV